MKSPEEVRKLIDEREEKLSRLHTIICGLDSETLKRFPWVSKRISELINELVLLKEIYYG